MASPTAVTLCKRFTNKYVPVVIGLRANNVRPYGADCTDRIDTVRRGRRTLLYIQHKIETEKHCKPSR